MSNLSLQIIRNVFHYRTGTLFNQKHAVRFKKSTSLQCPFCQQSDNTLHILLGCQHNIISGMITKRHNVACRLIMKAISKGYLTGCVVYMDAGSTDPYAQQNLQIPKHASNRTIPIWLFDARLPVRDRLDSSRPDAIVVTPLPANSKPPSTPRLQQVQQARSHGQVRRAHELNASKREIHLIEDIRPGHQLETSNKQHGTLCKRLKCHSKSLSLQSISLSTTIYTLSLSLSLSLFLCCFSNPTCLTHWHILYHTHSSRLPHLSSPGLEGLLNHLAEHCVVYWANWIPQYQNQKMLSSINWLHQLIERD